MELWIKALTAVDAAAGRLLTEEALVIVQIDPREFKEVSLTSLSLVDRRRYGNTALDFYQRNASLDDRS